MSDAVELAGGQLYALGDTEKLDGRMSWMPSDVRGWQPVSCYLIKSADAAVMVDTGVAKHSEVIAKQLHVLVNGLPVHVFFTRAESDAVGGLQTAANTVSVVGVHAGGKHNPFDSFDGTTDSDASATRQVPAVSRIVPGRSLVISPTLEIFIEHPLLRLLATYWVYHAPTKALFTSDSFGTTVVSGSQIRVIDKLGDDGVLDVDEAQRRVLEKFSYLRGAQGLTSIQRDLERIFTEHDIEIVAPAHGPVLAGREVVAGYYQLTQDVLSRLAS
jgi:flavorubredoxin